LGGDCKKERGEWLESEKPSRGGKKVNLFVLQDWENNCRKYAAATKEESAYEKGGRPKERLPLMLGTNATADC